MRARNSIRALCASARSGRTPIEVFSTMTEITRVPLQPIAKGSLTKIWLGVAAIALAAGGIAYAAMPPAVHVETLSAGSGDSPTMDEIGRASCRERVCQYV